MNLSGIRTQAGFYDYNIIKSSEVRSQQIREAKEKEQLEGEQQSAAQIKEQQTEAQQSMAVSAERKETDSGEQEYRAQYQPEATYDLKGAESDIFGLDVERAIDAMKKDQVLQQYQFFVGESKEGETLFAERENENFFL